MTSSPIKIDSLLEPLLVERSDERANDLLLKLIEEHARPVVKGVIRYKLRLNSTQEMQRTEAEDIYQDVVVQFVALIQQFREFPDQHPIADIRAMAAVIAHRTCSRWMRRQFPERHALKNRLHYLLTRQRGLALWQDEAGNQVAGFAVWQGSRKTVAGTKFIETEQISRQVQLLLQGKPEQLGPTVAMIFDKIEGPIQFDELVTLIANLLGIRDQPIESLPEDDETGLAGAAHDPDQAWQIEKKIFLERLWAELKQLPVNQRVALLLNLKDTGDGGSIALFPATGTATLAELADTLQLSKQNLAQLWNDLPLEDTRIAELLSLTRQQVINARKSGRERLARRLRGFF